MRISLVDALRGFALLGIVLIHNIEHFDLCVWPETASPLLQSLNKLTADVVFFMISGKAYAIFALLFGFSFFMQYEKRRQRGEDFRGRFVWRLCLLFGFGIFHVLFYPGEILSVYAVTGLILVPLRNVSSRALIVIATMLMLQPWEAGHLIWALLDPGYMPAAWPGQYFAMTQIAQQGTSFLETVRVNVTDGFANAHIFAWWSGRYMQTAALFLIGMLLGRTSMFVRSRRSSAFWTRTGLIAAAAFVPLLIIKTKLPAWDLPGPVGAPLGVMVSSWTNVTFMAVLVSAFALLWFHTRAQKALALLVPYGRMSLTNYISSSVIGSFVYYGYGLGMYRYLGMAPSLLAGIGIFVALLLFSRRWLARHKQGPLERLWYRLTWLRSTRAA